MLVPRKRRLASWLPLSGVVGLLAGLGGCGLPDYESRMEAQIARVRQLDEAEKSLGPPLVLPEAASAEEEAPKIKQMMIFLRPPRFVESTLREKEELYGPENQKILWRYPGKDGYNVFLAGITLSPESQTSVKNPAPAESPKDAKTPAKKETKGPDFYLQVYRGLQHFYFQEYKQSILLEAKKQKDIEVEPPQEGAISALKLRWDNIFLDTPEGVQPAVRFQLLMFQRGLDQVAVVYQIPREMADNPQLRQTLLTSLKTFEMGPAGQQRRQLYQKTHQKRQ